MLTREEEFEVKEEKQTTKDEPIGMNYREKEKACEIFKGMSEEEYVMVARYIPHTILIAEIQHRLERGENLENQLYNISSKLIL